MAETGKCFGCDVGWPLVDGYYHMRPTGRPNYTCTAASHPEKAETPTRCEDCGKVYRFDQRLGKRDLDGGGHVCATPSPQGGPTPETCAGCGQPRARGFPCLRCPLPSPATPTPETTVREEWVERLREIAEDYEARAAEAGTRHVFAPAECASAAAFIRSLITSRILTGEET